MLRLAVRQMLKERARAIVVTRYTLVKKTMERPGKMVQSVDFRQMREVIEHIPNRRDRFS